eukprot:CAMPEP_0119118608 /NCGR_PEP_ID=MMETSP1310-20130426/435_1 /TAXON_ID=464262 /ORGANISM="Genus nov. species nov., Strain RCC2339" /LENGTH=209 /DNA_ID=CAMNT_0007107993 /DNA_START=239 /DNA_END=868 /DNA_ORIENTATION=-
MTSFPQIEEMQDELKRRCPALCPLVLPRGTVEVKNLYMKDPERVEEGTCSYCGAELGLGRGKKRRAGRFRAEMLFRVPFACRLDFSTLTCSDIPNVVACERCLPWLDVTGVVLSLGEGDLCSREAHQHFWEVNRGSVKAAASREGGRGSKKRRKDSSSTAVGNVIVDPDVEIDDIQEFIQQCYSLAYTIHIFARNIPTWTVSNDDMMKE